MPPSARIRQGPTFVVYLAKIPIVSHYHQIVINIQSQIFIRITIIIQRGPRGCYPEAVGKTEACAQHRGDKCDPEQNQGILVFPYYRLFQVIFLQIKNKMNLFPLLFNFTSTNTATNMRKVIIKADGTASVKISCSIRFLWRCFFSLTPFFG